MTEDEAKTKWCPFAREASFNKTSDNRSLDGQAFTKCIGSQCMAWRYQSDVEAYEGETITDGYCGLAGKP